MDGRGTCFLHAVCPHFLRFTAYPGANAPCPCGSRSLQGCARRSWRLPYPPRALEDPGSPEGHGRGRRSSWRPASRCPTSATRDRPGRRRVRPGRALRRRPPPCSGPYRRLPTCRRRRSWPGRSPARWRGRGGSPTPRPPCGPCGRPLLPRPWPRRPAGSRPVSRPLPDAAHHRCRPA